MLRVLYDLITPKAQKIKNEPMKKLYDLTDPRSGKIIASVIDQDNASADKIRHKAARLADMMCDRMGGESPGEYRAKCMRATVTVPDIPFNSRMI